MADERPNTSTNRVGPEGTGPGAGAETSVQVDVGADEQVEALLEADAAPADLAPMIEEQEAPDAADTLERLEPETSAAVLTAMDNESAAEALAHMVPELAATVLVDLPRDEGAALLGRLETDDAADLVQALPRELAADLLSRLDPRRAGQIGKLALYDPETAGGLMTADFVSVRANHTIGEAIERVRRSPRTEIGSELFCVDDQGQLVGTITLRDLLLSDDRALAAAYMDTEIEMVTTDVDREDVARLFERYDLTMLGVVDQDRRLLGMVTIDDVIDIITMEHTEDALKQVGAGRGEAVYSSIGTKMRGRMPWMLINLITAQAAAAVLLLYHDLIALIPISAVIFPVIANQAGNTGQQSLAVTLRGMVLGEVYRDRIRTLLAREMLFGVLAGVVVGFVFSTGIAAMGAAGWISEMNWRIGVVAGLAMIAALHVGCLVGTSVPLIMQKLGQDPATASSIFLTCMTDSLSYLIFLTLLLVLQGWVM